MTLERTGSRSTWEKKTVTLVPDIESVSSTAIVMQVQINSNFQKCEILCFLYFSNSLSKSIFTFPENSTQDALR